VASLRDFIVSNPHALPDFPWLPPRNDHRIAFSYNPSPLLLSICPALPFSLHNLIPLFLCIMNGAEPCSSMQPGRPWSSPNATACIPLVMSSWTDPPSIPTKWRDDLPLTPPFLHANTSLAPYFLFILFNCRMFKESPGCELHTLINGQESVPRV